MRGSWKARPEPLVHRPVFEKKRVCVGPWVESACERETESERTEVQRTFGKKLKSEKGACPEVQRTLEKSLR